MNRLLKLKEAIAYLQVSRTTLNKLVTTKEIPVVKLGRSIRFDPADLQRFIDGRKEQ